MKGLIIKPYWADLILKGIKDIELRSQNTKIRGTIGIIKSKTKKVYGTVDLVDCIEINEKKYYELKNRHQVYQSFNSIPYKKLYGWVLKKPILFKEPIPYNHKKGCVIWVNIEDI